MENFEFYSPTRFVFGRGSESKVGDLVRKCGGTRVLLHFGGGSIKTNGIYDKVVASLDEAGVSYIPLGGVQPNPRSGLVREGIALCRREKVDFILAVGGGSVIDSAKAIAFGTLYDGDFADFYFGKDVKAVVPVPAALPVGTVLTLAAAGSEGSGNSVITLEPDMLKRAATGDALRSVLRRAMRFARCSRCSTLSSRTPCRRIRRPAARWICLHMWLRDTSPRQRVWRYPTNSAKE